MTNESVATRDETKEQVDARASELGVTPAQLARWVREGLVPRPTQRSLGRGSRVTYPSETTAQLRRAADLMREKASIKHARRRLWWEGYAVEAAYVRKDLIAAGRLFDRILPLVAPFVASDSRKDRMIKSVKSTVLTRSFPLLQAEERMIFLGLLGDATAGHSGEAFYHQP